MNTRKWVWGIGLAVFAAMYAGSSLFEVMVEYLWFDTQGYTQVFETILWAKMGLWIVGWAIAWAVLTGNLLYALKNIGNPASFLPPELAATPLVFLFQPKTATRVLTGGALLISLLVGASVAGGWQEVLLGLNSQTFGYQEPIFGRDASFYVFALPLLDKIHGFLWTLGLLSLIGVGGIYLLRFQHTRVTDGSVIDISGFPSKGRYHIAGVGAFLLLLMAFGSYLDRYSLLHQAGGLFTGPGYTEINATMPVLALKAAAAVVAAGLLIYGLGSGRIRFLMGAGALLAVVYIGGNLYGSALQRFVVNPNELEKERPYLQYHIDATNKAYALNDVVERPLTEETDLTARDIQQNRATINNIRLWDHEPLLDTFAQIQEIRTYYEFVSVDNDRYMIDGELRQVMLSPRELSAASLPSRTWVNERLTFTHGYGLTLGPVNRVNEQGLPTLFVQDLPPKTEKEELKIERPEIYFGELDSNYVFVKTTQKEFNFPEGDANIFSTYEGKGGVELGGLLKRILFSLYLRDAKVLLADDFTPETRVLMFRKVVDRVKKIAPFFYYDQDPYLVIHDGRMSWILDGYTLSKRFPYAEMVSNVGNYMRNPVKVVVDAYDGEVKFYLSDKTDPIVKAYATIFPGMFQPLSKMSQSLRDHLRHPQDYFNVQAHMYATYHMLDVNTFYNKEDQWEVPVVGNKRMEPYYTVMKLPGEKKEEFILMLPFTPRLKDNLAAWMVARSDGENYGKLLVYTFPKQKLIFGPKQMVARINQNPAVSQQITLWDQSGSNVIRGTLLVIPIENSLIYIQPIYLRAEEGRIPELKRVIVGYQNNIAMGIDLEDALGQIFGGQQMRAEKGKPKGADSRDIARPGDTAVERAVRQYEEMLRASKNGNWAEFGRKLEALGKTLREVSKPN